MTLTRLVTLFIITLVTHQSQAQSQAETQSYQAWLDREMKNEAAQQETYNALKSSLDKVKNDYEAAIKASIPKDQESATAEDTQRLKADLKKKAADELSQIKAKIDTANNELKTSKTQREELQKKADALSAESNSWSTGGSKWMANADKETDLDWKQAALDNAQTSLSLAKKARDLAAAEVPKMKAIDQSMTALQGEVKTQETAGQALGNKITGLDGEITAAAAQGNTARTEAEKIRKDAATALTQAETETVNGFVTKMKDQVFDSKILLANWETTKAKIGAQAALTEQAYAAALNQTLMGRYVDKKVADALKVALASACNCGQAKGATSLSGVAESLVRQNSGESIPIKGGSSAGTGAATAKTTEGGFLPKATQQP